VNHFYRLEPEEMLDTIDQVVRREDTQLRCSGRILALNSLENRVMDVELDDGTHLVAKFYRPNRWSEVQLREEHKFLAMLDDAEIPVVAPFSFGNETLFSTKSGIFFTVFPKIIGRLRDELFPDQLETLGRYLGRIHQSKFLFRHRLRLSSKYWIDEPIRKLLQSPRLMDPQRSHLQNLAEQIKQGVDPWLTRLPAIACHGDCHLGNVLWEQDSPFFLDFDDSILAPAVQDVWMVVRGRGLEADEDRASLLKGYEVFAPFDRNSLNVIELFRALRILHYSAWIDQRWEDPSFEKAFPQFGSQRYWQEEIQSLSECLSEYQEKMAALI
jgi:Ser/Thr protein kinase RdoA (MazF antagonist)